MATSIATTSSDTVVFERFFTPGLAQVAYAVADRASGEAALVDPRRDVAEYLRWLEAHDLKLTAILETHVHADFVSGARELAAATGAPIYASRLGAEEFPHLPLDDGDEVNVGALRLRAYFTPGHTPEHLAYLLLDPARGSEPLALFSGDSLFVGDVGRPDLLGASATRQLAEQLFETVERRFKPLEDALIVYPGHTAGSSCGKKIGDAPHTTIGQERIANYAFHAPEREQFIAKVLEGMPTPPTYYPVLKRVNKVGAPFVSDLPAGGPLSAAAVAEARAAGAMVVDTRDQERFGAGHIPGALFAGLGSNFLAWMGWVAPYDHDLILVLERPEEYEEARTELRRIGLDRIAGYLQGGMEAWRAAERPVTSLPQLTVGELAARMRQPESKVTVLDVRSNDEWNEGHIAGATHTYAGDIAQGVTPELPASESVAVICGSGYRSSVASSLLQSRGLQNLINVRGGMEAWNEAGLPVTGVR